jgi:pimeloyl-ACP methyl ester carboxylesterase
MGRRRPRAWRAIISQAGEGPLLLLLHGWPQHWYEWRNLVPLLAGERRLLMPDLRGFGWSQAPGRGYDPETFAAGAVALLDAGFERDADDMELEWIPSAGHFLVEERPDVVAARIREFMTP